MIILEIIWFVFSSLVKACFKFLFSWCYGIFGWMLVIAIICLLICIILSIRDFIDDIKRKRKREREIKPKAERNKKRRKK